MKTTRRTLDASFTPQPQGRFLDLSRRGLPRSPRASRIDLAASGTVAVVRPDMPRLFRILLAMTGVRV